MAQVNIKDVSKTYDTGITVIKGVNIDIQDGEFIVIVGASGCGKSTLLRMVAGLEAITDGEISINGKVVNKLEPKDRDIAMVFQNYALYPHMSIYDNMAYGLKIQNLPKSEIDKRVKEAADMLQITPFLDRKPRQLSGGQRQRVAMGRAIVRNPAVFLFDEPLSNLDAKLRVQMRLEIRKLQKRLNVTSLYVTHDQVEAMTMADRLIVLNGGVAEQIGTPLEIYDNPASQFVAGFIGSPAMNFLPVTLTDTHVEFSKDQAMDLPDHHDHSGSATLGIRPEHIEICAEEETSLHLYIDVVEALGSDSLIHGRILGLDNDIIVRVPDTFDAQGRTSIPIRFIPDRTYLFDAETGKRI